MPDQRHRRWEYRVVRFPHEDTAGGPENLNGPGYDGWEAVGVVPRDLGELWVILKRESFAEAEEPERRVVGFGR